TGAARELPEALIVNPYDTDECAAALDVALTMPATEQRIRMRLMRGLLQDFNVFRWAGRMLLDAASSRRRGRVPEFVAPRGGERQSAPARGTRATVSPRRSHGATGPTSSISMVRSSTSPKRRPPFASPRACDTSCKSCITAPAGR